MAPHARTKSLPWKAWTGREIASRPVALEGEGTKILVEPVKVSIWVVWMACAGESPPLTSTLSSISVPAKAMAVKSACWLESSAMR